MSNLKGTVINSPPSIEALFHCCKCTIHWQQYKYMTLYSSLQPGIQEQCTFVSLTLCSILLKYTDILCLLQLKMYTDIFSISHNVIAQSVFYIHGHCDHGYNWHYTCAYAKSIISHNVRREIPLVVKAALHMCLQHSCNTCLDNLWHTLYYSVRMKYVHVIKNISDIMMTSPLTLLSAPEPHVQDASIPVGELPRWACEHNDI